MNLIILISLVILVLMTVNCEMEAENSEARYQEVLDMIENGLDTNPRRDSNSDVTEANDNPNIENKPNKKTRKPKGSKKPKRTKKPKEPAPYLWATTKTNEHGQQKDRPNKNKNRKKKQGKPPKYKNFEKQTVQEELIIGLTDETPKPSVNPE